MTHDGQAVLGEGGPITIEGNVVEINENGEILVDKQPVDKLQIVSFADQQKLIKQGASLFSYEGPQEDEIPLEKVSVQQGTLEMSNVSTVMEMTKMIGALISSLQRSNNSHKRDDDNDDYDDMPDD